MAFPSIQIGFRTRNWFKRCGAACRRILPQDVDAMLWPCSRTNAHVRMRRRAGKARQQDSCSCTCPRASGFWTFRCFFSPVFFPEGTLVGVVFKGNAQKHRHCKGRSLSFATRILSCATWNPSFGQAAQANCEQTLREMVDRGRPPPEDADAHVALPVGPKEVGSRFWIFKVLLLHFCESTPAKRHFL